MLIQKRTISVKPGYADQVVERFSKEGALDARKGLIDITVMVNKRAREVDEVALLIRWESEEAWKAWEKSPEHIQGHRDARGKQPPEYVISTVVSMYEVKKVRVGKAARAKDRTDV
ncbi:antibiotic biosynthesis monooxygenase [Paenibacillus sp. MMS18-CY102]|uniref:antibiotic biosynthesis monooxygenase n=1 Tax=Paenibacillus sp. MMS18-CY102 TaxID=2682849 RepID=UPI0013666D66|nr:antibiotic biosynthesis monooxygenase [Paenibacillus sp. MMS18-CY102]MWC31340.1 antibiotic biosynthesis monooxygenase [Paenibacillus sp. MMS18-CY102]